MDFLLKIVDSLAEKHRNVGYILGFWMLVFLSVQMYHISKQIESYSVFVEQLKQVTILKQADNIKKRSKYIVAEEVSLAASYCEDVYNKRVYNKACNIIYSYTK